MGYVLTDFSVYVGKGFEGTITSVFTKEKAISFKTKKEAENFLSNIPKSIKSINWRVFNLDDGEDELMLLGIKKFGNPTKPTVLEEDGFDIVEFFTNVIQTMSQLERFIANMTKCLEIVDMKIMDIRHYIRDKEHNLSAIQMQRLGYYLQELERERYDYKSKKTIASMFVSDIYALKDTDNIHKIKSVVTSKYRPRIMEDGEIEDIINKKKNEKCIGDICEQVSYPDAV